MRISEILGLEWSAIDFEFQTIHVNKDNVLPVLSITPISIHPKRKSDRLVLVDTDLLDELRRWQKQQSKNRLANGTTYQSIFTDSEGFLFTHSVALLCVLA